MRALAWSLALFAAWSSAATALAFSEPLLYPEPTLSGGGGGRFFTGSPLDGFSCAVCHQGGAPPTVTLKGFPDIVEAGKKYEVELSWTDGEKPHALNLEIVDTNGAPAGTITLPDEEDVDEEGRCALSDDEAIRDQVAASLVEHGSRRIISVLGCGAQSLKFTYQAGKEEHIALTAAVVRSNQEEDTDGDGVLEIREISRLPGEKGSPVEGCASSADTRASLGSLSFLALATLALLLRRRIR